MESFKNIEKSYQYVKKLSFFVILLSLIFSATVVYYSFESVKDEKNKIYVLVNNKALEIALLKDVDQNRPAELKSFSEIFHKYFFELDPDQEMIEKNIKKAIVLGGPSVSQVHDRRTERLYYHNLIQGGISTEIEVDSIKTNLSSYPYRVIYYGKERIIRPSNITINSFVSSYKARNVKRSENNPHGFFIENYEIIDYQKLKSYERKN